MPSWRLHDLRQTVSTMMHEALGIPPPVVEACINHVSGHQGGIASVYNLATCAAEKRAALDRWGNVIMTITNGGVSNMVTLHA